MRVTFLPRISRDVLFPVVFSFILFFFWSLLLSLAKMGNTLDRGARELGGRMNRRLYVGWCDVLFFSGRTGLREKDKISQFAGSRRMGEFTAGTHRAWLGGGTVTKSGCRLTGQGDGYAVWDV
ncbi:hypothetical protein LZ32DRAFT_309841 [Colletotrichum eremochloae]|nr:hypothetical protein LZ32DRAFT_309841 [Colletotrichum eremochloae]